MGNWLTSLTSMCSSQLNTMGDTLNTAKNRYMSWNDDYYKKAQQLSNQEEYKGQGATAFLEAVDTDINTSRTVYDGLGHVGSACSNLGNVMSTASSFYDNKMTADMPPINLQWQVPLVVFSGWRDKLIQGTLDDTYIGGTSANILNNVLQSGQTAIAGAYHQAYQSVEAQVIQDAAAYALQYIAEDPGLRLPSGLDPRQNPNIAYNQDLAHQSMLAQQTLQDQIQQVQQQIRNYYLMAYNQLADEISRDLSAWANEIMHEYQSFQNTVKNSEGYLTARDLYDYIYTDVDGTQGTSKPIAITPYQTADGKTGLLITLGGTDLSNWAYDTDLFTALQTGQGYDNPYLNDVKQAIQAYMQEHLNMTGSEITIAGYSLGGMTAQQLAQDIAGGQDQFLKGYNLQVNQVITYGAPVMGPPVTQNGRKVQYNMYDATYDPVPLLSSYENSYVSKLTSSTGPFAPAKFVLGASSILTAQFESWDAKLHGYIDPHNQYGSQIHNINDVGNNVYGNNPIPFIGNHLQYQDSNQLNVMSTATTNIDVSKLGPTEYFDMKNTENLYSKTVSPVQNAFSDALKFIVAYPLPLA